MNRIQQETLLIRRWTKRLLVGVGVLLLVLAAVGTVYQLIGSASDVRSLPPPG